MSVVPSALPSSGKSSVSIFGRRVSTDALLLAGASVVAIILLYRSGGPGASAAAPVPVGTFSGDGSTFSPMPSNQLIASAPAPAAPSWTAQLRGNVNPDTGQDFGALLNVPVYSSPGNFSGERIAELSNVQISGPAVSGPYTGGQTRMYLPFTAPSGQTEYLLAQDVTYIPH